MNNLFEAVDKLNTLVESQDVVAEKSFGKWRVTVQPSNYNNDKLTCTFYDLSQDPEKFPGGQQTPGTYYVDSLLGDSWGPSIKDMPFLMIDNEVPAWKVEHEDLTQIAEWLEQFSSENQMNENATEEYWDAKEIARKGFKALLKFNFGSDANGNNYIITNDNNEVERIRKDSDDEAIEYFNALNEADMDEVDEDHFFVAVSDSDPQNENEYFNSKEEAVDYCKKNGLDRVIEVDTDSEEQVWEADDDNVVYVIYTTVLGPNGYESTEYDRVYDGDQAADIVSELHAQGINASYDIVMDEKCGLKEDSFDSLVQEIYDFFAEYDPYDMDDYELDIESIKAKLSDPDEEQDLIYNLQEISKDMRGTDDTIADKADALVKKLQMTEDEDSPSLKVAEYTTEDTGGHVIVAMGKLTNGSYFGLSSDCLVLFDEDYHQAYLDDKIADGWEDEHYTTYYRYDSEEYKEVANQIDEFKLDESYKPTDDDWDDINHWYNDDPREEWDRQEKERAAIFAGYDKALPTVNDGRYYLGYNLSDLVDACESFYGCNDRREAFEKIKNGYLTPGEVLKAAEYEKLNKIEEDEESRKWLSAEDIEWLNDQGYTEKLDKILANYKPTGDVEADERNLNNKLSDYFYDKVGIYNERIDSLCTKWAHDKAIEINNGLNESDLSAYRKELKNIQAKYKENKYPKADLMKLERKANINLKKAIAEEKGGFVSPSSLTSMIKKLTNLKKYQSQTTAIKGYHTTSGDFEVDTTTFKDSLNEDDLYYDVYFNNAEYANQAAKALKAEGFSVKSSGNSSMIQVSCYKKGGKVTESEHLNEDNVLYGIYSRSSASGNAGISKWDGKYIAFTNREEASKCRQAMDDQGGYVNNFISHSLTEIPMEDEDRCIIFDTYEQYREFADKALDDKRKQDDEVHAQNAEVRDGIASQIAKDLTDAGFTVYLMDDNIHDHESCKDVTVRTSIYCYIILDVGLSYNKRSYGSIKLDVDKNGIIKADDYNCFIAKEPYEECKDYIIKAVTRLSNRSEEARKNN